MLRHVKDEQYVGESSFFLTVIIHCCWLLAACQVIFFSGYHVCMQTWSQAEALSSARARSCHTASQRSSFESQHVSRTSSHTCTAPSSYCFIHHCSRWPSGSNTPRAVYITCRWIGLCLCVYVFVWVCLWYIPSVFYQWVTQHKL